MMLNKDGLKLLRSIFAVPAFTVLLACTNDAPSSGQSALPGDPPRTNILLIVADDLGYGDLGAFGGEIDTPSINSLAESGARFTSFYTQVSCSPTRSILLTGIDNHLNGLGTMAEDLLPHHAGNPGYVGYLNDSVVTVAKLLADGGYETHMAGKWHLGKSAGQTPEHRGFQNTFALLDGGGNHFNGSGVNAFNPRSTYSRNGTIVERPKNVYSSDLFTNELLDSLEKQSDNNKPFFAFLSFTAPHFPLQAPADLIDKYADTYTAGWGEVRKSRFERMKELGLVASNVALPPRIEDVPSWQDLSADDQRIEAKKMAIYAAMIDNLDSNVGRLIEYLKDNDIYDNTIVIFMSDNGADPYDRNNRRPFIEFQAETFDNSFENMGTASSFIFAGLGWAQVSSVHHRHYKFLPSEGGIHAPMIMRYPGVITPGHDKSAFVSINNIAPTFLDIAGIKHPGESYEGRKIYPVRGKSMLRYLQGEMDYLYSDEEPISLEIFGHGTVFLGPWKAVKLRSPWAQNEWQLYNLDSDPSESNDVSASQPDILATMISAYTVYTEENNILEEPDDATAYPYKPGHRGDLIPTDAM